MPSKPIKKLPRFEISPLSKEDGGGYLIEFIDYPGCIADGETPEEALHEGMDALEAYQTGLRDLKKSKRSELLRQFSGQWRQRVPISLHAEIARKAKQEGVSLNSYVSSILSAAVGWKNKDHHSH